MNCLSHGAQMRHRGTAATVFPGGPATQLQRRRSRPPMPQVHEPAQRKSDECLCGEGQMER
eukprot:190402-Pyramimonas_sp.AAC.1